MESTQTKPPLPDSLPAPARVLLLSPQPCSSNPDSKTPRSCPIPLYSERVSAGFPSPAQDYVEQALDLNELCIKRPAATFFVRVEGESMIEAGIFPHDILVVDRSLRAGHGDIVIACVNGEFTVKELCLKPVVQLLPRNRRYSAMKLTDESELDIFGVVTSIVRNIKKS